VKFAFGFTERAWPVQARRAFRCATIQSRRPSRFIVEKDEEVVLVPTMAVRGDVDEIFWYRKGIPSGRRLMGERRERVDITFSIEPVRPSSVPRLVYSVCDGERFMERREKGEPRTWNEASGVLVILVLVGEEGSGMVLSTLTAD